MPIGTEDEHWFIFLARIKVFPIWEKEKEFWFNYYKELMESSRIWDWFLLFSPSSCVSVSHLCWPFEPPRLCFKQEPPELMDGLCRSLNWDQCGADDARPLSKGSAVRKVLLESARGDVFAYLTDSLVRRRQLNQGKAARAKIKHADEQTRRLHSFQAACRSFCSVALWLAFLKPEWCYNR